MTVQPQRNGAARGGRVLVTSALPYANGPIHFGHMAGAYLPADIYVRTLKALGREVVYVCGTDEYGVAITLSSRQAGVSPARHVDHWHQVIRQTFDRFNIRFDHFSRTTTPRHAANTQAFFSHLVEAGLVEPKDSRQLFCARDNMFLPDRYVTGSCPDCDCPEARGDECPRCGAWIDPLKLRAPLCKVCGSTPEKRATRHWYLMLDRLQPRLEKFIQRHIHWKKNVRRFVSGLLAEGLQPRPVTRDLSWGVPVPLADETAAGKVIYVWFDAPIGYISATQEWAEKTGSPEKWRTFWQDPAARIIHFVGKDNIPFHCLTFPAMLMGQPEKWNLAHDVPANEFFNLEGGKFNTSSGWYIDLDRFFASYSADMIRWAIARNLPETADAEFTWRDFQAKVNGELADIYGNLAHRVQTFIHRYFDGVVPSATMEDPVDAELLAACREAPQAVAGSVEQFRLREAAVKVMDLARLGNRFFDAVAPWKLRKTDRAQCGSRLNRCVLLLETLAVVSVPFIPDTAKRLWCMLGCEGDVELQSWARASGRQDPAGRHLGTASPLFKKIDDDAIEAEVAALKARAGRLQGHDATGPHETCAGRGRPGEKNGAVPGTTTNEYHGERTPRMSEEETSPPQDTQGAPGLPPLRPQVVIDDFLKCDFRLGRILEAEAVPGSKKLLKFSIDIGLETRTILAGIQQNYAPEELVGKTVVVIANLAPRRMMGFTSQGMVLAAEVDGKLSVLTPLTEGLKPGAQLS